MWSCARASVKLTALGEDYAETEIPLNVRQVSSPVSSMVTELAARPRESLRNLPDTCVAVSHAVYTAGNLRPFESREFPLVNVSRDVFVRIYRWRLILKQKGFAFFSFRSWILKFSGAKPSNWRFKN